MRLYNVEQAAQDDIHDVPVFDNTTIGKATKRDFNKLFVGS